MLSKIYNILWVFWAWMYRLWFRPVSSAGAARERQSVTWLPSLTSRRALTPLHATFWFRLMACSHTSDYLIICWLELRMSRITVNSLAIGSNLVIANYKSHLLYYTSIKLYYITILKLYKYYYSKNNCIQNYIFYFVSNLIVTKDLTIIKIHSGQNINPTGPIDLPPHAPVAQKIADQRWLVANSAKNKYFFILNDVILGWLVWINIVFSRAGKFRPGDSVRKPARTRDSAYFLKIFFLFYA